MAVPRNAELLPEMNTSICGGRLPEETTMSKLKLLGAAAVIGCSFIATAASAVPLAPLPSEAAANVEQVRWVCGPFRCFWRPYYYGGYGAYGLYRRPFLGGGWGYRHWRRW
jgi:hypothetical protein